MTELILYRGEQAKQSHKELFSLNDDCYFAAGENIIDALLTLSSRDLSRLHISADWETILKIAVWTSDRPSGGEVLNLVKKSGLSDGELTPFLNADIGDLFPRLYYGNRLDILRRVCNAAKAKAESKIGSKRLLVYCHLVSNEAKKIVASSL
jgi:hypothetical protein